MNKTVRNIVVVSTAVLALAALRAAAQIPQKKEAEPKKPAAAFQSAKAATDTNASVYLDSGWPSYLFTNARPRTAAELDSYIDNSKGILLVKLGTTWCPPCLAMDADASGMMQGYFGDEGQYLSLDVNYSDLIKSKRVNAQGILVEKICEFDTSYREGGIYEFARQIMSNPEVNQEKANKNLFASFKKVKSLKNEGDRVAITIDGGLNYFVVLEGGKLAIYSAAVYGNMDKNRPMVPIWVIFKDGKRIAEGATYDLRTGRKKLESLLEFISKNLAVPENEKTRASGSKGQK